MTAPSPAAGDPTSTPPPAGTNPVGSDLAGLQALCEEGSELLVRTRYLQAERVLAEAERMAWAAQDWDTLARLYMPLQEARRQRRQRCGEGSVVLDLVCDGPDDCPDADQIVAHEPHGQLLVAGWGDASAAARIRQLAAERELYVETFLAAAYPVVGESALWVVLVPDASVPLPQATPRTKAELSAALPPGCLAVSSRELPVGPRPGDSRTYAEVMALWERLHRPFLATADAEPDPVRRMQAYRATIDVDYACELAHQRLSDVAHTLARV
jgi:hypothetical protein